MTADKQTVQFEKPVKARFLRLIIDNDHAATANAAIAELEPLVDEAQQDVRNLGIVPGFNDK